MVVPSNKLKFKTDLEKSVLVNNFEKRGWTRAGTDDEWQIYWALPHIVKGKIFNPDSGIRLNEFQILNHFPNADELCKKDLMVKNIKRYRKDLERDNNPIAEKDDMGRFVHMDIIPQTYIFPGDYNIFVEEFRRQPNSTWIMKPSHKAQGQGIFLVTKLTQLKRWATESKMPYQNNQGFKESYVISKYLEDPLLIGGKKFDLRIYVLVTGYRPLKVYLYELGFCRFCVEKYNNDFEQRDNMFIHLTNVAIAKQAVNYNDKHGGKWTIQNLKFYLEQTCGKTITEKCFDDINNIIYISLKAVQNVVINDKHCFEVYGFDVLIDNALKPWLIEVNASPSLSTTTEMDRTIKMNLINDTFKIVIPHDWSDEGSKRGTNMCKEDTVGFYTKIIDESA